MQLEEILQELSIYTGKFPKRAVEAAIEAEDEITPKLLEILERTIEQARNSTIDFEGMGHIYALYLLSQFKDTRAYPLIIELMSLPDNITDNLWGDSLTEDASQMLVSVCDGNTGLMRSLVENSEAYDYSRGAALEAILAVEYKHGSRESVIDYFKYLFETLPRQYDYIWGELVIYSTKLYPEELYEDIKQAFEEELVDEWFIRLSDVDETLKRDKDKVLEELENVRAFKPLEDAVKAMEWWAAFQPKPQQMTKPEIISSERFYSPVPKQTPIVKDKKIGRNEPCPCGSGKKYKKCCGKK